MERDYQKDLEVCESFNYLTAGYQCILKMALFVQNTLPYYIKRCMDLESQLQQAHEREAALRKALKYEVMYHGKNCTCKACQALSAPAQPSRYRETEKVVELVRLVYNSIPGTGTFKKELIGLYDALTAYDKAGEGAGK